MIRVYYRPCGKTHNEQHTAAYELLDAAASLHGYAAGRVEKTKEGKPFFPDVPALHFSIAHTDGYAVVAIGDAPCGVDIEKIRLLPERVCRRYLDGATGEEALYRWTERESYGKLDGRGFFAEAPKEKVVFCHDTSLPAYLVTVCVKDGTVIDGTPQPL